MKQKRIRKVIVSIIFCLLLVGTLPIIPFQPINQYFTAEAATVKINKKTLKLDIGDKYTLKITGSNKKVSWSSSKKAVATVSANGKVNAKKAGTTTITAKVGKKKYTCKVTVKKQSVTSVKLNKKNVSLLKGKKITLKATLNPSNASSKGVIWRTSNKKVATVSAKGVVKAIGVGKCTISAISKDNSKKKAVCTINVRRPVTAIKLNKTSLKLTKKGGTATIKATITPKNAYNKNVTWSSSNKNVATVSSSGKVKAVGNGVATITVKAKDGSGKKATCKVTVKIPTSIFKASSSSLKISKSGSVKITFNQDGDLTYNIDDPDIISCYWDDKWNNGTINLNIVGHKTGKTNITITNSENNKKIILPVTVTLGFGISLQKLPITLNYYGYFSQVQSSYRINDINYSIEENGNRYYYELYVSGTKIYNRNSNDSSFDSISYKIYDGNSVVSSGIINPYNISVGENFINAKGNGFLYAPGNYRIVFSDTKY